MKIKLRNRLEVLMKDAGISTFEEMSERLTINQQWSISRSALSRKFRDENPSLTMEMIAAICNELQCLPSDLFEISISSASQEEIDDMQNRILPFRYGTIRKGVLTAAEDETTNTAASKPEKVIATQKQKTAQQDKVDLDSILGPKVSHLHAGKLNKGK